MKNLIVCVCVITLCTVAGFSRGKQAATGSTPQTFPLTSLDHLTLFGARAEVVTYKGRKALRLTENKNSQGGDALIENTDFSNGVIEAAVAGTPAPGAAPDARGFVGISFRAAPDASRYECFYIRPTNGRADDQLWRNHSAQYVSHPDYPWNRPRQESPGVYESYVDLEPGVWTKLRIVVEGVHAKLYVNDATQPTLLVNDLKAGETHGQIGLWIGSGTEAYFSNLKITPNLAAPSGDR